MEESMPIELVLHIEKKYVMGTGSLALLSSADMLGTKAIRIEAVPGTDVLEHQDTIEGRLEKDLLSLVQDKALPMLEQFGGLAVSLDSLSHSIHLLVSNEDLAGSLSNLESVSASLNDALSDQGSLNKSFSHLEGFTAMLAESQEDVAVLLSRLGEVSADLDAAGLDKLGWELQEVALQLKQVLHQLNSQEGSLGLLLNTDTLHTNLNRLLTDLDSLVRDLNENPEDYVQISVFGKKDKKQ
jgi:phospholipid/cholesterol/gamma-HCH transport system substrate-binding protein